MLCKKLSSMNKSACNLNIIEKQLQYKYITLLRINIRDSNLKFICAKTQSIF